MALPVITVASGGMPVSNMAAGGMPVTEVALALGGIPVTKVTGSLPGLGVTYVSATGGPAVVPTTWNPSDKSASINLTNGNLTATSVGTNQGVRAIKGYNAGKFYFEVNMSVFTSAYIGLSLSSAGVAGGLNKVGATSVSNVGSIFVNSATQTAFTLGALSSGQVIGIAINLDASPRVIYYRVCPAQNWNGNAAHNPGTGAGGVDISVLAGALFPHFAPFASGEVAIANFGASAFVGAVPSGFTAGWPA